MEFIPATVNSSLAIHQDDYWYLRPPINHVFAVIFGFLIIFSISGNLLVLLILIRFRRMRTRTNLLLANMSAIDLLTGLLSMPFSMMTAAHGDWPWLLGAGGPGYYACQINGFLNALFIAASIHTLMYISIHKYFSIRNVFKTTITTKHIIGMMAAAWIWGILFATGLVAGWTTIEYKIGTTQCGPKVPDRDNILESSHSIFTSVTNFVIPLMVIVFCYSSIFHTFGRHISALGDDGQQSNVASAQQRAFVQQKKIAVTLIIVLVCFLICVLPYIIYSSASAFSKNKHDVPAIMNPIAYIFLYLASCVNPVIYALRSEAFLTAYRNFLCCKTIHFKRRSTGEPTFEFPDKTGWRRLSAAIHDTWHMAISRETLSSAARSRQNSLFSTHTNKTDSRRNSPGIIPVHHLTALSTKSGDSKAAAYNRVHPVEPGGLVPVIYRPVMAILEERSSQLAKWDKNPETDSGRAESDGEYHDSPTEHRSAGSSETGGEVSSTAARNGSRLGQEVDDLILESEKLLEEIAEERSGYRMPLPAGLVDTIV